MLAGAQDNGSPATNQATTNSSWTNVLGGDGGYNAIDPIMSSTFYASNPDIPPEGLGIQLCSNGVFCNNAGFNYVVTSSGLDGDDGAFYFPYILDPGSEAAGMTDSHYNVIIIGGGAVGLSQSGRLFERCNDYCLRSGKAICFRAGPEFGRRRSSRMAPWSTISSLCLRGRYCMFSMFLLQQRRLHS